MVEVSKVIAVPSNVLLFKGNRTGSEIQWTPGPTVEDWIGQLESYFDAESITDEALRIAESKRYLHPSEGDARKVVGHNPKLKTASTFKDFRDQLVKLYKLRVDSDPYGVIQSSLELEWGNVEGITSYAAGLEERLERIKEAAQSKFSFSICEKTARLFLLGVVRKYLAAESQLRLTKKAQPSVDLISAVAETFEEEPPKRVLGHQRVQVNYAASHSGIKPDSAGSWIKGEGKARINRSPGLKPSNLKQPIQIKMGNGKGATDKSCFYCGNFGHFRKECRKRLADLSQGRSTVTPRDQGKPWENSGARPKAMNHWRKRENNFFRPGPRGAQVTVLRKGAQAKEKPKLGQSHGSTGNLQEPEPLDWGNLSEGDWEELVEVWEKA